MNTELNKQVAIKVLKLMVVDENGESFLIRGESRQPLPDYAGDTKASWVVWEKMRQDNVSWNKFLLALAGDQPQAMINVSAESICRAALKAVERSNDVN